METLWLQEFGLEQIHSIVLWILGTLFERFCSTSAQNEAVPEYSPVLYEQVFPVFSDEKKVYEQKSVFLVVVSREEVAWSSKTFTWCMVRWPWEKGKSLVQLSRDGRWTWSHVWILRRSSSECVRALGKWIFWTSERHRLEHFLEIEERRTFHMALRDISKTSFLRNAKEFLGVSTSSSSEWQYSASWRTASKSWVVAERRNFPMMSE